MPADRRGERGSLRTALVGLERRELLARLAERLLLAVRVDVRLGGLDDPQRVGLGLLGRVAPRGDAVPAEDAADRLRVLRLDRRDVQAQLEARAAPRHPDHLAAEDLLRQLRAVLRRRDRDARVGMQVVDVCGIHQPVHRRVDRRRRAALAVQAVVERRDHLVLAVQARVDVRRARACGPGAARPGPDSVSVPRSPPEPLTHSSSTGSPVTGSVSVPFAEVLPPA